MAIQLNATEERHAKDSVICDRNKGVAIHALLLSLLNRLGVAPMEGRKSTANGIGVNGAVTTAIHKARKAHMAKGHKETEDSVRAFVSPVWTHGIAPFLTFDEKADEWVPDWANSKPTRNYGRVARSLHGKPSVKAMVAITLPCPHQTAF